VDGVELYQWWFCEFVAMKTVLVIAFLLFSASASATTVGQALEQCALHIQVPSRGQITWSSDSWKTLCLALAAQAGFDPADPNRPARLSVNLTSPQQTTFDGLPP
jgi:hypothetical protein